MTEWHYVAQRALTGEFLDLELPLVSGGPSWALSGAGSLSGTIAPDRGLLRAPDGRLVLEEWGTYLYAVAGNEIRWGGILVSSTFQDETWTIEAAGFATYPHGLHYDNAKSWTTASPELPFQELWANAQWRPNARLGVFVITDEMPRSLGRKGTDGENGPVGAGDVDDETWAELLLAGWTVHDGTLFPPLRIYRKDVSEEEYKRLIDDEDWREEERDGVPDDADLPEGATEVQKSKISDTAVAYLKARGWTESTRKNPENNQDVVWLTGPAFTAKSAYIDAPLFKVSAAPYELFWWESPDIGAKIDELTTSTPFDWVEKHFYVPLDRIVDAETIDPDLATWLRANGWTADPTDNAENLYRPANRPDADEVAHIIRAYYPRTGTRREDLAFIQGDNVTTTVAPTLDGDEYANAVTGLGAGEGVSALRREVSVQDGRLYRGTLYTDKAVTDGYTLASKVQTELIRRQNLLTITSITVRDHPNAPIGSWALGDDILVQANVPWLGDVALWCRITGWTLTSDSTATLTLARSDSYRYGG